MIMMRCFRRLYLRSMVRSSLYRLAVLAVIISVVATIVFFIYSLGVDNQRHSGQKIGQVWRFQARPNYDVREAPKFEQLVEKNPKPMVEVQSKATKKPSPNKVVREKTGRRKPLPVPIDHKPVLDHEEKMGWPDIRRGEKGRLVEGRSQNSKAREAKPESFLGVKNPLAVPSVAEYCNLPVKKVHGREGEAQPGYALKSVYVVVRHGDRSPYFGLKNNPNPVINCEFNKSQTMGIPSVRSYVQTLQYYQSRLHPGNTFQFKLYPNTKMCEKAQLTGHGALQHLLMGQHLNERYVQKWRLFSQPFTPDQVYIKSTGFSRTYQSAVSLLYTFLPVFNLTSLNLFRSDNLFFCSEKTFGKACSCPHLGLLKKMSDSEAGKLDKDSAPLKKLRQHIAKVLDLKTKDLPWLWSMMDVFMSYACHKLPLPCNKNKDCISPVNLAELWRQMDLHGYKLDQLQSYQKYSRLALYPLLYEIKQHMVMITKRKAKVKFVLYSGHDTTLGPLATALGIGHGKWPKLATRIVFELYARDGPKKHHFIRILINGEDVTSKIKFCRGQAKSGFCKLKYFVEFVQKDALSMFNGQSYAQACDV